MKLTVGLDETGTETQLCDGWCYFGLPESHIPQFNLDVDAIKVRHGITGFHAKKYKSSQNAAYAEFLQLIERNILAAPISICSTYLYRKDWNRNIHGFSENVFEGATDRAGITNPNATKVANKILPPLLSLINIGKNIGNNHYFEVHFDSDNIKNQIDSHVLSLNHEISLTLRTTICIVANTYRDINFPNAPSISSTDIQVKDDEKSNIEPPRVYRRLF